MKTICHDKYPIFMTGSGGREGQELIDFAESILPGTYYIIVDELPEDYEYRNYWVIKDGVIITDPEGGKSLDSEKEIEWRNSELIFSDIEIFKCEDLSRDAAVWREYRIKLRNYPNHPDFPNTDRPVAPEQ